MSFQIMLMKNSSNPNVVDKDVQNVDYGTGVFREPTSILDPVVLVQTSLQSDIISKCNYARIEELGRYYYITNIVATTNSLWEVHMHVDVLMSYKDQIRQQYAVVERQTNRFNMHLDDGWLQVYSNPHIYTRRFHTNSDGTGTATTPFEAEEYVLAIAGNS